MCSLYVISVTFTFGEVSTSIELPISSFSQPRRLATPRAWSRPLTLRGPRPHVEETLSQRISYLAHSVSSVCVYVVYCSDTTYSYRADGSLRQTLLICSKACASPCHALWPYLGSSLAASGSLSYSILNTRVEVPKHSLAPHSGHSHASVS